MSKGQFGLFPKPVFWKISTSFDFYRWEIFENLSKTQKWPFSSSKRVSKVQLQLFPKYQSQTRLDWCTHFQSSSSNSILSLIFFTLPPSYLQFIAFLGYKDFKLFKLFAFWVFYTNFDMDFLFLSKHLLSIFLSQNANFFIRNLTSIWCKS